MHNRYIAQKLEPHNLQSQRMVSKKIKHITALIISVQTEITRTIKHTYINAKDCNVAPYYCVILY